jgi:protein-S-isoprenylcysteine O-methyltransferase Ste14
MADEQLFRWPFVVVFAGMISISIYFRSRARRSGENIARAREGSLVLLARMLCATPLYLPFVAYGLKPDCMKWAAMPVPPWMRWLGAAVGLAALLPLFWLFTSIGSNISETVLTKEKHQLVTRGPFRWVRHPLYSVASIILVSMSILAANWFMLAMACLALVGIAAFVIPREEAELVRKFGPEYREYMERTGRLVPRLFR